MSPIAPFVRVLSVLALAAVASRLPATTWTVCPAGCDSTTIQAAVDGAADGDEIVLSTTGDHVEAGIVVDRSVEIRSPANQVRVLEGGSTLATSGGRIFWIASGHTVVIRDLEIRHGSAHPGLGGAIRIEGELLLDGSWLHDNLAASGGALYNEGHLEIVDSVLEGNDGGTLGGAIYNVGTVEVRDTTIDGNEADGAGGIYNGVGGVLRGADCTMEDNRADGFGGPKGGHLLNEGTASLTHCVLSLGRARDDLFSSDGDGGAISNAGTLSLEAVLFEGNEASGGFGGGLHQSEGKTTIRRSVFEWNQAAYGGAVHLGGGTLDVRDAQLRNNAAESLGGGIYSPAGRLLVAHATLQGNEALDGGALFTAASIPPELTNVTLSDNVARRDGGGIYVWGQRSARLASVTLVFNAAGASGADGDGGGIYIGEQCDTPLCFPTRAYLEGTILAGNQDLHPGSFPTPDCSGLLESGGYNLLETASSGVVGTCRVEGDLTGVQLGVDPQLGPLEDHGGPSLPGAVPMLSHAPSDSSAAVDAGNPAGCRDAAGDPLPVDQRHASRNAVCDLGAFEVGGTLGIFADGFESGDTAAWSAWM